MELLGFLLGGVIIGAVGTVAACISFAFDELSEKEKERQAQMNREYEAYERRKKEEYQNNRRYFEQKRCQEEREYQEQLQIYQKELLQRRKEENWGAFRQMLNLWKLQYEEKQKLLEDCRKIVQSCRKSIRDQQHSNARFNSMKSTLHSLEEASYKLEAYLSYMETYKCRLKAQFEDQGDLIKPFSMTLPADHPYEGKVLYLDKRDFHEYRYSLASVGQISLDNTNRELFDSSDGRLPFMFYTAPNGGHYLSLAKGLLKDSVGGTTGLDMEVLKVFPNKIFLRFAGDSHVMVNISKRDLNGRNRRTPVGSNLHVFVKDYDFSLKEPITVSERAGDGMSIAQFDSVVMVQTNQERQELYQYIRKHNLLDESSEWRIGPCLDEHQNLTGLILQNGIQYALRTSFETVEGNGLVLRYHGRLQKEEFLTFEDAFVTTDVTVNCYSQDKIRSDPNAYNAYFEECEKLRLYLTREFAVQRKILERSPMSLYLDQWLEVTERLIKYRVYGGHMQIKIDEWESIKFGRSGYTLLHVDNEKYFRKFQEREAKNNRNRFFLELSGENGGRRKCKVISDGEDGIWLRAEGEFEERMLLDLGFTFDLYSVDNAYTERQQVNAFRMFKEGKIASEAIKTAIINVKEYQYSDSGHRIEEVFNQNIQTNPSQIDAITRAFSEKNFFLIQGPPGTGKTTVIKELILQQLRQDSAARILVVSQANVAVDNVLRGIIKMDGQDTRVIRCGSEDRIVEDDIKGYSFDRKFEEYQNKLYTDALQDSKALSLRKKWLQIIEDKGNTDLVGECLLGCFQIIGATCLGLENRHYGLSGMEFDLVVIDEAGKALAGELLIPINHARKVIIIGDHLQLPPVIDPVLYKGGDVQYDDVVDQAQRNEFTQRSFFQRLYEECPDASKCMLNVQFRMPPDIAELISKFFYHGTLESGENCSLKKPMFLDHHLIFVDMKDEADYCEAQDSYSGGRKSGPYNRKELEAAAAVVKRVRTCYNNRIVIITPYRKQKNLLCQHFEQEKLLSGVSVNTIDAFQGDEADIVIYCTTRAKKTTDYFSDTARLNVAFSRTRNTLIFLGSSSYLKKYPQGHILRDIGTYLAKRAAVVPYAQWMEIDLRYNADFGGRAQGSGKPKELLPLQNAFFLTREKQPPVESTCRACGKMLSEYEDSLCSDCISKIDSSHRCRCCKKAIPIPYYDIYLRGATVPELCTDCQEAHYEETTCSACGVKFYIQHEKREELLQRKEQVVCQRCGEPVPMGYCRHCERKILLPRWEVNQRKYQRRPIYYCPDCEMQRSQVITVGYCKHCSTPIKITHEQSWNLEKNGWQNPEYCKQCKSKLNEEVLVGYCKDCHTAIKMTNRRKWQLEDEGKQMPELCNECLKEIREKVKVGKCQVCGHDIMVSRRQYERSNQIWYDICKKCRDRVAEYEYCTECDEEFEITYGEKMFFERNGLDLPKRCKKCRKERREDAF